MSLWKIAWRSIQQRALASGLTAFSMALGVALVVAVIGALGVIDDSFRNNAEGFHLVIGAKGGKEQLVLNTIYHLSTPVENIPYSLYKEFITDSNGVKGRYASQIAVAIPFCLGDNYQGFRVVGTTPQIFEIDYAQGRKYEFADGVNFQPQNFFDAVIGATVARETKLKVGDKFQPTHGIASEDGLKHDAFRVVGVLAPTGTPNDRALFVNIEGFYLLEGHALDAPRETAGAVAAAPVAGNEPEQRVNGDSAPDTHDHPGGAEHAHEPLPEELREITAMLVRTKDDLQSMMLMQRINEGPAAQAVQPIKVINGLMELFVGRIEAALLALASLIVVVAGIGIMVSIYNSMSDRRRDIAVMRALGAGRRTVLSVILAESVLLSVGGGVAGFVLGRLLIVGFGGVLRNYTGVSPGFLEFVPYTIEWGRFGPFTLWSVEMLLVPVLVLFAALVGYLPAMTAYRTDVAKALTANP